VIAPGFVVPIAVATLSSLGWMLLRLRHQVLRGDDSGADRFARVCIALWLAGLLLVTLGGRPRDVSSPGVYFNWVPFATQTFAVHRTEIAANLFLFIPLGLLLPWILGESYVRAGLVASATSLTLSGGIELIQTYTALGTAGDITDILLNTFGGVLAVSPGVALLRQARRQGDRRGDDRAGDGPAGAADGVQQ
jgi:VanZ like family